MKKLVLRLVAIVAVAGACALAIRPAAAQEIGCPDSCGWPADYDAQCEALSCASNQFCAVGCAFTGSGRWVMRDGTWEYYVDNCSPYMFCYPY